MIRADLLAIATVASLKGFWSSNFAVQMSAFSGLFLAMSARDVIPTIKSFADVSVTLLGDATKAFLAAARLIERCETQPCGQVATSLELFRIADWWQRQPRL